MNTVIRLSGRQSVPDLRQCGMGCGRRLVLALSGFKHHGYFSPLRYLLSLPFYLVSLCFSFASISLSHFLSLLALRFFSPLTFPPFSLPSVSSHSISPPLISFSLFSFFHFLKPTSQSAHILPFPFPFPFLLISSLPLSPFLSLPQPALSSLSSSPLPPPPFSYLVPRLLHHCDPPLLPLLPLCSHPYPSFFSLT